MDPSRIGSSLQADSFTASLKNVTKDVLQPRNILLRSTRARGQTNQEALPFLLLSSASLAVTGIEACVDQDINCTREHGYAVSFGAISCISVILAVLLKCLASERVVSRIQPILSLLLLSWWAVGACVLTFVAPYDDALMAPNGYFCTWAGFVSACFFCYQSISFERFASGGGKPKLLRSHRSMFVLFLASVVELIAAIEARNLSGERHMTLGRYRIATSVGAVSTAITLIFLALQMRCTSEFAVSMSRSFGVILVCCWVPGVYFTTFDMPFKKPGNGFFASWIALFASIISVNRSEWPDDMVRGAGGSSLEEPLRGGSTGSLQGGTLHQPLTRAQIEEEEEVESTEEETKKRRFDSFLSRSFNTDANAESTEQDLFGELTDADPVLKMRVSLKQTSLPILVLASGVLFMQAHKECQHYQRRHCSSDNAYAITFSVVSTGVCAICVLCKWCCTTVGAYVQPVAAFFLLVWWAALVGILTFDVNLVHHLNEEPNGYFATWVGCICAGLFAYHSVGLVKKKMNSFHLRFYQAHPIFFFLFAASLVLDMAAIKHNMKTSNAEADMTDAHRFRTSWAIPLGGMSVIASGIFLVAPALVSRFNCITPATVTRCRRALATLMFGAWLPGVYLLTFKHGPFHSISNAYFASWLVLYASLGIMCMEWSDNSSRAAPPAESAEHGRGASALAGGGEYHEI
jgi:hypothetical protein